MPPPPLENTPVLGQNAVPVHVKRRQTAAAAPVREVGGGGCGDAELRGRGCRGYAAKAAVPPGFPGMVTEQVDWRGGGAPEVVSR